MDPKITIIIHEDDLDVRGNAQASGNDADDQAYAVRRTP